MLGHAAGGHLNMVAALGAWAALRRARGQTMLPRPAASAGLNWEALHACGTGAEGQALMTASSRESIADKVTYGEDGLAPIYVNGQKVKTRQLIPLVCGPTPKEVAAAICAELRNQGAAIGQLPSSCA